MLKFLLLVLFVGSAFGQVTYKGPGCSTVATLVDASTVTWALNTSPCAILPLGHALTSRTVNVTGAIAGTFYSLKLPQDSTGGATTVLLGTGCTWQVLNASVPATTITITSTANAVNQLVFYYDGSNCVANFK